MKKITAVLLMTVAVVSCKKEEVVPTSTKAADSVSVTTQPTKDSVAFKDSVRNESPEVKAVLRKGIMRETENGEIIRIADGSMLPFTIGEELTDKNQRFILKIKNFEGAKISAAVTPANENMNIRINQIKLPDGSFDGPFGRDLTDYKINEDGEVWLIIGKSNMASGDAKGGFSLSVE